MQLRAQASSGRVFRDSGHSGHSISFEALRYYYKRTIGTRLGCLRDPQRSACDQNTCSQDGAGLQGRPPISAFTTDTKGVPVWKGPSPPPDGDETSLSTPLLYGVTFHDLGLGEKILRVGTIYTNLIRFASPSLM